MVTYIPGVDFSAAGSASAVSVLILTGMLADGLRSSFHIPLP